MKLILAILNDEDAADAVNALAQADFNVLRIDSSGGFFRQGNSTLMIGSQEDRVRDAIAIIDQNCPQNVDPLIRRGTVLVLDVDHFEEI